MGWVVNGTPKPRYPPGMTRYPLYKRLGGPQGRPGQMPPPGTVTNSTFCPTQYTFVWISKRTAIISLYNINLWGFWGFAKLRKATISFDMSVCLPVRPDGTTRLPLKEFSLHLMLLFFENLWRQLKFFKARITGISHDNLRTFMIISRRNFLRMRCFQTKSVAKIKTHLSCSVSFFPKILPFMR